ncbi:MAG: sodium-translocating pyrophosphatase [Candidatus Nanohalarchaeota archaeon]|nr:MAG: sodium-translocating pyrophosphatase [Candidatus Nanohaloarchaeota archaeon]
MNLEIQFALAGGIAAILFAIYLTVSVLRKDAGTEKMKEISHAIHEGAMAFMHREYKTIAIFTVIITAILAVTIKESYPTVLGNHATALGFFVGAVLSATAGYIGMNVSVRSNVRVANAAKDGLNDALKIAFRGGAVTGMSVAGLALIGVTIFYYIFKDPLAIVGFGFGASLVSLFARVGGGIYTKAADVGADLVGKIEAGIPEDDPRNPAVIADNVGDNVGDCAGMGADLFETYAITAIGAMLLGHLLLSNEYYVIYPLLLGSVAIFASILSTFVVKAKHNIMSALYRGVITASILSAIGFYFVTDRYLPPVVKIISTGVKISSINIYYTTLIGLALAIALFAITEYYTSTRYKPVRSIAEASLSGSAVNIITGLAVGLESTAVPLILISAAILGSFQLAGLYGIGICVMAMISLTAMIIALDSYGPITDNAGGIAEMAKLPAKTREITDSLDSVGNTTKAVTKTFAIGSAALAALTLFAAYVHEIERVIGEVVVFAINDPRVLIGLFIGSMIPFLFSSWCMRAVGRSGFKIVEEVRRQFREIKGIMTYKAKPDYAKCVDIVTVSALHEMRNPAILAVVAPLAVGFLLGPLALGGLLLGSILSGVLLAIQMSNGGGAWDNAKKYIEDGNFGGKNSDAHKAAIVGDTVGDPFKDTAGPAINPLIKVMNTIALIFIALIVKYALF